MGTGFARANIQPQKIKVGRVKAKQRDTLKVVARQCGFSPCLSRGKKCTCGRNKRDLMPLTG